MSPAWLGAACVLENVARVSSARECYAYTLTLLQLIPCFQLVHEIYVFLFAFAVKRNLIRDGTAPLVWLVYAGFDSPSCFVGLSVVCVASRRPWS